MGGHHAGELFLGSTHTIVSGMGFVRPPLAVTNSCHTDTPVAFQVSTRLPCQDILSIHEISVSAIQSNQYMGHDLCLFKGQSVL